MALSCVTGDTIVSHDILILIKINYCTHNVQNDVRFFPLRSEIKIETKLQLILRYHWNYLVYVCRIFNAYSSVTVYLCRNASVLLVQNVRDKTFFHSIRIRGNGRWKCFLLHNSIFHRFYNNLISITSFLHSEFSLYD